MGVRKSGGRLWRAAVGVAIMLLLLLLLVVTGGGGDWGIGLAVGALLVVLVVRAIGVFSSVG